MIDPCAAPDVICFALGTELVSIPLALRLISQHTTYSTTAISRWQFVSVKGWTHKLCGTKGD